MFQGNVDVGDPLSLARKYDAELIDELVFYDITASAESRRSVIEVIEATSDQIFIPFTVGGGRRAGHAPSGFEVTSHGGRRATGLDLLEW
jgi:imidazole glycerol phosphate synthase subunit HisF